MIGWFALGQIFIVAGCAFRGCALENGAIVAGFAGDADMRASQGKAGFLVREVLINLEG